MTMTRTVIISLTDNVEVFIKSNSIICFAD